ncbi:hypothetical protein ACP4OV_016863 [Aristida adscensionis]
MTASRPLVNAAAGVSRPVGAGLRACSELERDIARRHHSGSLRPDDALRLFDELLPQARPASVCALNTLLAAVARAPADTCSSARDGDAIAVSLFNRMARAGARVAPPSLHTYGIIIGCCCRAGRLDLGFAVLGQVIKTGWRVEAIIFTDLLRALCAEKRTADAAAIVLRRMPELGCTPDVFSYTVLLNGLCSEAKSQEALELLHVMADDVGGCNQMW